jgi:hypothetical protein
LHEGCDECLIGRGFDGEAEENEGEAGEAVRAVRGLFGGEAEEQGKIGDGALLEFAFIESEEMREVATGRPCFGEGMRRNVLQAKIRDGFGEGASEAGCLRDGGEVGELLLDGGGMNNSRGQRFDAEAGNGSKRETAHGLRGKMGGELRESERVNALAARWERTGGKFVGGGSCGGDDEDLGVLWWVGEERGGVLEKGGVGTGMNERARDHRQLYWVAIR